MNNIQNKENKLSDQLSFAIDYGKSSYKKKVGKLIVINPSIEWKSRMDSISKEVSNNPNNIINNLNFNTTNKKEDEDIFISIKKSFTKYQIACDIFEIKNKSELHNMNNLINICKYSNIIYYFIKISIVI